MPEPNAALSGVLARAAEAGVPPLMLTGSPWAIRRDMFREVLHAARFPEAAAAGLVAQRDAPQPTAGVAVIPLTGIITPMGSWLSLLFGGAPGGLCGFRETFRAAVASPDISAIVLDVDSPGGIVSLVPETAAEIREARGAKPIVAIADTLMCSAAYWIGSQADELVATPSAYVGSIGVYRLHEDWSGWNEKLGIDPTYVHAGEFKVEGNIDEPLGDEAREQWQQDVDDIYEQFIIDVAEGRGVAEAKVLGDFGQGRTMNAKRAAAAGLVDRVATYEDVVAGLLQKAGSTTAAHQLARSDTPPRETTSGQKSEAAALLTRRR